MEINNAPPINVGREDVEEETQVGAPEVRHGGRVLTQPDCYQADYSNVRYTYPDETDTIHTCFQGTGCKAKNKLNQECCNATDQLDRLISENPPPVGLKGEQFDEHIMGVIMAENFP